jgi:ubiquitin carboxyl-terminal hydrolase 4/11/15
MASVPCEEEQSSAILSLQARSPLIPGERAFLVSAQWLSAWKRSVGFPHSPPVRSTVPPIENDALLSGDALAPTAREGLDFEILAAPVWAQLLAWYGGGPELARAVLLNPLTRQPEVLVRVPHYQVFFREQSRVFALPHFCTVGELKTEACRAFAHDPGRARLCDFEECERSVVLDEARTLLSYQFFDGHFFLLEFQRDDGQWVTVEHRPMSRSSSMQTVFASLTDPGLCGLVNIGNSCYMGTVLQCLAHLDIFLDYFVKTENWRIESNMENPRGTQCEVLEAFAEILKDLWNADNSKVSPRAFKFTVGKFATQFARASQEDAAEFLTFLLDMLHEDLNRAHENTVLDPVFGTGEDDAEVSERAWQRHRLKNDSFIVDTFHGQLRSRNRCPNCEQSTIVFDPFSVLPLPLPVPQTISPPFIFVPNDITQPRLQMTVTVIEPATLLEYVESISKHLGRRVHNVIFAERVSNETVPRWRQSLHQTTICYAFEIPVHSAESVFVPVRLLSSRAGSAVDVEIDGIFLVEMPRPTASEGEALAACERHFASLWRPTPADAAIAPELLDFEANLTESRHDFAPDERMRIRIVTTPLDPSKAFDRERKCKFVSSRAVQVLLNPHALARDSFDWSLLRRVVESEKPCEIEKRQSVDLDGSLRMFSRDEQLDMENRWFCPHCQTYVCARKQMSVWRLPPVLICHFKRFMRTASSPMKVETKVKCPLSMDMTAHVAGPKPAAGCGYRMCASMHHSGGLNGGHYVAHAFHSPSKRWYLFDDAIVKPLSASGHGTDAYVVCYVSCHGKKVAKPQITAMTKEAWRMAFVPRVVLPVVEIGEGS